MTAKEPCPNRDTVAALLLGKLSLEREATVNAHLEACATCAALAQQIEQESDPLIEALRQPMSPPTPALVDGDSMRIEGYRILGEIGRGGMGVVYRAHQQRLDRPVAIKMILAGQFAGPDDRVRFRLEGALLARLNHPNFVQVYEVGTLEIGPGTIQPYLVLEFVEGSNLKAAMANRSFSFREAAERILILARAMEAAHAQGIVHRDLKPANVLIAADETLKITDFGLAKELSTEASLTPTGLTVGTPHYMAPEQAQGDHAIGPAADIYALGSILYEMLTGRTPFAGTTAVEVIMQVLQQTPIPASRLRAGVPRDLETICLKCLEKNPRARYSGAADLANDLACWLENRPIQARPAQLPERVVKWSRRHPLPATLVAFLVLTLRLGSAASTYFGVLAAHRADEAAKALTLEAEARKTSDRRAAELQHVAGQAAADAGEVDRGMFLMLRALELAEKDPELRRVIELDLAAWEPYLPRLRWYRDEPFTLPPVYSDNALVSCQGNLVSVLDTGTGRLMGLPVELAGKSICQCSVDGLRLCALTEETDGPVLRIFERSGKPVGGPIVDRRAAAFRAANPGSLYRVEFSRDKQLLWREVWGPWAKECIAWDLATGKERGPPLTSNVGNLVLLRAPSGSSCWLWLKGDRTIEVVEVETGRSRGGGAGCLPPDVERPPQLCPERNLLQTWLSGDELVFWDLERARSRKPSLRTPRTSLAHSVTPSGQYLVHLFADHHVGWQDTDSPLMSLPTAGVGRGEATEHGLIVPDPIRPSSLVASQVKPFLKRFDFPRLMPMRGAGDTKDASSRAPLLSAVFRPDRQPAVLADTARRFEKPYARLISTADNSPLGLPLIDCDSLPTFSPSGRLLALSTWDDIRKDAQLIVRIYDAQSGEPRSPKWDMHYYMHKLEFSPDERHLAVGHVGGVDVFELAGERPPLRLVQPGPVTRLRFRADGRYLAAAGRAGWPNSKPGVQVWDLSTGKAIGQRMPTADAALLFPEADAGEFRTLELDSGRMRRWDFAKGALVGEVGVLAGWPGPLRSTDGMAWNAARDRLALGTPHGAIHQWNLRTLQRVGPDAEHPQAVLALEYSADGEMLAAAGDDGAVGIFDARSAKRIGPLRIHGMSLLAMAFQPDGHALRTITVDGHCQSWDLGNSPSMSRSEQQTWLEAATGLRLKDEALVALSVAEYEERVERARRLSAPLTIPDDSVLWDAEEAHRAEQAGQFLSARLHLDDWIAKQPKTWLPLARRARIKAAEDDASGAAADMKRAAALAPNEVETWRRHEAVLEKIVGRPLHGLDGER
jgi:eukaryotic-like serine/threonine-protein kinase